MIDTEYRVMVKNGKVGLYEVVLDEDGEIVEQEKVTIDCKDE